MIFRDGGVCVRELGGEEGARGARVVIWSPPLLLLLPCRLSECADDGWGNGRGGATSGLFGLQEHPGRRARAR